MGLFPSFNVSGNGKGRNGCGNARQETREMDSSKISEYQERIDSKFRGIGKGKYGRIMKMARTPTSDEYRKILMITGLGIIVIGAAGFAIMWLMTYLPGYF